MEIEYPHHLTTHSTEAYKSAKDYFAPLPFRLGVPGILRGVAFPTSGPTAVTRLSGCLLLVTILPPIIAAPPAIRRRGFFSSALARAFNKFRGEVGVPADVDEMRPSPERGCRSRLANISSMCRLAWCVNTLDFERVSFRLSSWDRRWSVSNVVWGGGDTTYLERELSTSLV